MDTMVSVLERLERIERVLAAIADNSRPPRAVYNIQEVAEMLDRTADTIREWCRYGRIKASRRRSGRGPQGEWVISHEELERYRREGLLPSPYSRKS